MTTIHNTLFGCSSTVLTEEEKAFFAEHNPVGLVLFARNIDNPSQVKQLVADFKKVVCHETPLILIDQEGGRVQRMTTPHWRKAPPQGVFANVSFEHQAEALVALELNTRLLARDLKEMGINVNCLPVMDVPVEGSDNIIGDRAYGPDPDRVSVMSGVVIGALYKENILPILKHIPGHGRATVDSHKDLPRVTTSLEELRETDFIPFKNNRRADLAMTAHIVYEAIDPDHCATQSTILLNDIIREEIGFNGLIMTDDLGMHALAGSMYERAQKSVDAGVDLLLHCSGDMAEMKDVARAAVPLTEAQYSKLRHMHALTQGSNSDDIDAIYQDYQALMKHLELSDA